MTSTAADQRSVAELKREREFLLRSIEDLEREHAARDVDDEDYASLRAEYVGRAAAVLRALSEREAAGESEGAVPRRAGGFRHSLGEPSVRRLLIAIGVVCVLGIAGIAAASVAGVRLPGQSATGTVTLPKATQINDDLAEAALLASSGSQGEAVALYNEVLGLDPHQPEALTYRGWLLRLAGRSAHSTKAVTAGDGSIREAVAVAPGYPDARAFDAIAIFEDQGNPTAAAAQVAALLRDHPSSTLLSSYGRTLALIDEHAKVALPKALARYAT